MPEKLKNTFIFIAACFICLIGIEIALRMFGDEVLAMGNQFRFYQFDEKLGWRNAPGTDGYLARSEYRVKVDINSLGMRDREPLPKTPELRRIAAMGDSFTWGIGGEYGKRYTEVLEELLPHVDVLNYGVSGYGTTQHLVQLDRVLAEKPDYVILAFCLSNDVMEALTPFRNGYNKPFAHRTVGGVTEVTGYPLINTRAMGVQLIAADSDIRLVSLFNLIRKKLAGPVPGSDDPRFRTKFTMVGDSQLYTPDVYLTAEQRQQKAVAFEIVADLLSEMNRKITAEVGPGRFLVALVPTKMEVLPQDVPSNEDGREMGDQLISRLNERGIKYLDPRGRFSASHFWRRDGHWNADGHRLFADILAEYIRAEETTIRPLD